MARLSTSQRNYLRKLAHPLKPVVQIGKHGMTDLVIDKVNRELDAHELIKVKFGDFQDLKHDLLQKLADETGSELVAVIGNTAILYRAKPDPDRREIVLPAR